MMKIELGKITAHIGYNVAAEGSVLRQTVKARAEKIAIHYDMECAEEPARVAALIRNARNGCYVRQTINNPDLFTDSLNLNGQPFNFEDYPAPTG